MSDMSWRAPAPHSYPLFSEPVLQPRRFAAYGASKRAIDITGSALGLLLLSPLLLVVALAVKLDSPGPLLFSQVRVGERGRQFRCWKFRSMFRDAEQHRAALLDGNEMAGGTTFKIRRDPRITGVGRFIRRASIDELPQDRKSVV